MGLSAMIVFMESHFPFGKSLPMKAAFSALLISCCIGCHPVLRQEFYNNTGHDIRYECCNTMILCRPGERFKRVTYLPQEGSCRDLTILDGTEIVKYRNLYKGQNAHLLLWPFPIPIRYWRIRFQIDSDGAIRLIRRRDHFPLKPSAPQPEGFPKYPAEIKTLTPRELNRLLNPRRTYGDPATNW